MLLQCAVIDKAESKRTAVCLTESQTNQSYKLVDNATFPYVWVTGVQFTIKRKRQASIIFIQKDNAELVSIIIFWKLALNP